MKLFIDVASSEQRCRSERPPPHGPRHRCRRDGESRRAKHWLSWRHATGARNSEDEVSSSFLVKKRPINGPISKYQGPNVACVCLQQAEERNFSMSFLPNLAGAFYWCPVQGSAKRLRPGFVNAVGTCLRFQAGVVSNSRDKIQQTWPKLLAEPCIFLNVRNSP